MSDSSATRDDDRGYSSSMQDALRNPIIRSFFVIFGLMQLIMLVDKIMNLPADQIGWRSISDLVQSAFMAGLLFFIAIAPSFYKGKQAESEV
jgi:hypothetical protein